MMDFMYLPEKQFYDVCDDGIIPHFDALDNTNESLFLESSLSQ